MAGKNKGICHSCRKPGHYLSDCPTKKRCLNCGQGFEKCMEVEKNTSNKERLFLFCTRDCGHLEWKNEEQCNVESRCVCSGNCQAKYSREDLSCTFNKCAQIITEKDIEIWINITMCKGRTTVDDNGKGNALMEDNGKGKGVTEDIGKGKGKVQ